MEMKLSTTDALLLLILAELKRTGLQNPPINEKEALDKATSALRGYLKTQE